MRRYFAVVFSLFALALLVTISHGQDSHSGSTGSRTLKVTLDYTGSGTVDENHRIFVSLFDTPEFMHGKVIPLASKAATSKTETVTFSEVTTSPVYAAASYYPSGNYDGTAEPPPSGSSLGMYSKTPGTPEPITLPPGKTIEVRLSFDDRIKMP